MNSPAAAHQKPRYKSVIRDNLFAERSASVSLPSPGWDFGVLGRCYPSAKALGYLSGISFESNTVRSRISHGRRYELDHTCA
jgi:hypothetical protein